jgi:chromosome segregation ATPase
MADLISDPYFWVVFVEVALVVGLLLEFRNRNVAYQHITYNILEQNQAVYNELKQFNQDMKVMEDTFRKFIASLKTMSDKFSEMNESLTDVIATEDEAIKELKSIPKFIQRTDYLDKKLNSLESFIKATNNSQNAISKFNENSKAFQKTNDEQRKVINEMQKEINKLKDSSFLAKLINDPRIQDKDKMIQLASNENEKVKRELNAEREEKRKTAQEMESLRVKNKQQSEEIEKLKEEKKKLERGDVIGA